MIATCYEKWADFTLARDTHPMSAPGDPLLQFTRSF